VYFFPSYFFLLNTLFGGGSGRCICALSNPLSIKRKKKKVLAGKKKT